MQTKKPFTADKKKKMKALIAAANHICEALKELEEAKDVVEDWSEYSTLSHFRTQLVEFMSCDSGQGGFEPYLMKVSDKFFFGGPNPLRMTEKALAEYRGDFGLG